MPEWLTRLIPDGWGAWHVTAFAAAFSVASAVVSLVACGYVLGRLPADYFVNPAARNRAQDRHPAVYAVLVVGRNLAGYFLIALGVVLSLPGVPGQGILTILMGVMLVDVPGKLRLERWLVTRRPVLAAVNRLRAKVGTPPLVTDAGAAGPESVPGGERRVL